MKNTNSNHKLNQNRRITSETKMDEVDVPVEVENEQPPLDEDSQQKQQFKLELIVANEKDDDAAKQNVKNSQIKLENEMVAGNKINAPEEECLVKSEKKVSLFRKILRLRVYIDSVFIRFLLMSVSGFSVYYLACIFQSNAFLSLYCVYLVILIDGVYVVIKRNGHDYYWFSITITAYVVISLIFIFCITEFKLQNESIVCNDTQMKIQNITDKDCPANSLDVCYYSQFIIIVFLASLVVARWFLPNSKRMSQEAIYYQIAGFTSSAADIIDIADYFSNTLINSDVTLNRAVRFIFTLNLIQFCFSLQAIKRRNTNLTGVFKFVDILFVTEAWSQLLIFLTQELPCLIIRLIFIFSVEVGFEFSLYFFVIKNALMCILLLYRVGTLTYKVYDEERKIKPV